MRRRENRANPVVELQYAYLGLHQAALSGNVGLVQYALSQKQPVDAVWDGISALHAAAAGGSEHVAKLLIDSGADVNFGRQPMSEREFRTRTAAPPSSDPNPSHHPLIHHLFNHGSTPLHFACAHNNAAVARLLLASGAAPHIPDKKGVTPLDLLPPATPPTVPASSPPSPPPDTIRTVIREYYEKEKAKEKEFQKSSQLQFHGKAAAVLGFPKTEDDLTLSSSSGTTAAPTTSPKARSPSAKRSMEGLLTMSAGSKIRTKSPPPSPARNTFVMPSSSASTTPPPPSHPRRPSFTHPASSSHRTPSPSLYHTRTRTPSSSTTTTPRPYSADGEDTPLFGTTAHLKSATLPTQHAHSPSITSPYLSPPRPPKNKRSLLSLFTKKESPAEEKSRQASFGATSNAGAMLHTTTAAHVPVTAPPGRTTFATAAETEVFVEDEDDEEFDYGNVVNPGRASIEYDPNGGASSGSEGDASASDEEPEGLGLEFDATATSPATKVTPPKPAKLSLPSISTSSPPVPKIPLSSSPHLSPVTVRRTPPSILRGSSSGHASTSSPLTPHPSHNILRRSGSLRFQDDDTDERPSTRERKLCPFGTGRKSMDAYDRPTTTRSPILHKKNGLILRERTSTPILRDHTSATSPFLYSAAATRHPHYYHKSPPPMRVPPLPSLDHLDPASTTSTEDDTLDGRNHFTISKGPNVHTVSSMAEAKALSQEAAQKILELQASELEDENSQGPGMSLSEQLAAYGEKLAIERRFAKGEKQRWKSEKARQEDVDEDTFSKEKEDAEKQKQERMQWSQQNLQRYTKDREKDWGIGTGIVRIGVPLERTTSLEKEGALAIKTSPSPSRTTRKIRRPHTSDSVHSSPALSSTPRFGHASGQLSSTVRIPGPNGEHLRVFQRDRDVTSFDFGPRDREHDQVKHLGRRSEDILRAFDVNFEHKDRQLFTVSAPPMPPIAPPVIFATPSGASSSSNVTEESGGRARKRLGIMSLFGKK